MKHRQSMHDEVRRCAAAIRRFIRVTGFATIFVLCTAFECYQTSSDIQYAQGYGYVIGINCTYNCKTANTSTAFYLTFDTYDQAKAWLDRWNQGDRGNFANGARRTIGNSTDEYGQIAGLLRPVPIPFTPSDSLELNQPHPYVPQ